DSSRPSMGRLVGSDLEVGASTSVVGPDLQVGAEDYSVHQKGLAQLAERLFLRFPRSYEGAYVTVAVDCQSQLIGAVEHINRLLVVLVLVRRLLPGETRGILPPELRNHFDGCPPRLDGGAHG